MIFSNYASLLTLLQTIVVGAGGIATAILAVWGLWVKVIKPWIEESRKSREEITKAIAYIEGISEKLEKVSKELQPNGGGSIKDQVKQIANDIKIMRVEKDATFYLSKEPSFKSDEKGYYTSINYSLGQLVGVSESELLGLGWLNYIALEDKDRIWEEWENIMESGKEISLFYGIKNPTTMEVIPVKCRAVINRDNDKILSVIGTIEPAEKKHYKKLKIA